MAECEKDQMEAMIAAIKQGSLRQVGMLLRSGIKPLADYADRSGHKYIIELAAECGQAGIVTKLLKAITDAAESDPDTRQYSIQLAFERAADNGHLTIAKKLVKAGADSRDIDRLMDNWVRCPICYQTVSPGAEKVCEHYFGTNEGGEIFWAHFPNEEVSELESLVEHIDVIDRAVPAYLEPVLQSIIENDEYLWADNRTEKIPWASYGMASGAGYHWFHPDPHYTSRLSNKFERAIRWLKKNMKDQLQDFE